jgi:hypothetical protein
MEPLRYDTSSEDEYVPTKEELIGESHGYCYMQGSEAMPGTIQPMEADHDHSL